METVEEHPHWGTWCPRLPHTKAMSGSPQHTVGTPHSPQEPPAYSILYQGADEACPGWHRGQPCSSQSWVHGPALGLPATPGTAQYWARVTPSLSPHLISSVPPSHGSPPALPHYNKLPPDLSRCPDHQPWIPTWHSSDSHPAENWEMTHGHVPLKQPLG